MNNTRRQPAAQGEKAKKNGPGQLQDVSCSRGRTATTDRDAGQLHDTSCFSIRLSQLEPAPENDDLYRPVGFDDPEIQALARSIREHGIREPLVITLDNYILSGHRRYKAARLAGLREVPARRELIRRSDDLDRFVVLLREHNRQREKSRDERAREEVLTKTPDDASHAVAEHREVAARVALSAIPIVGTKTRAAISKAKRPMLDAIQRILQERSDFWPLSDRQIHYALLNDPPPLHTKSPERRYANTLQCYKGLCDLLIRARIACAVPWECISDDTRPMLTWTVYPEPGQFVRRQLDDFLKGYSRDLLRSQPNQIELIAEKNTVASVLRHTAAKYRLPMVSGRGYCSGPPRHAIAERFRASGKQKLVLLMVGDFDPDGEDICHSFARSMRDDFGIASVHPIKVALTAEQVSAFSLPPVMKAKKGATGYSRFVERHGDDVFEVEALPPADLQRVVSEAIDSVLDIEAFNAELDAERKDAAFLQGVRVSMRDRFADLDFERGPETA